MTEQTPPDGAVTTSVADVRQVPLNLLTSRTAESLRRVLPPTNGKRVSVSAFNASL